MKLSDHFVAALEERSFTLDDLEEAVRHIAHQEEQDDGRIRVWEWVADRSLYLRVVFSADGETIITAHFDENFTRKRDEP
jgi:hypothetical protein